MIFWQKELLVIKIEKNEWYLEEIGRYEKLTKNNEDPVDLEKLKPHRVGLPIKFLWFCLFEIMKNDYKFTIALLRDIEKLLFLSSLYPPAKEKIIKYCAVFVYYNETKNPISLSELNFEKIEKELEKLQKIKEFQKLYANFRTLVGTCVKSKNKEMLRLINEAAERKTRIILRTGLFSMLSIGFLWYKYLKK